MLVPTANYIINLFLSKPIIATLAGTFELNDRCVDQCPTGSMSVPSETGGMKCQDCDGGICPKGKNALMVCLYRRFVTVITGKFLLSLYVLLKS